MAGLTLVGGAPPAKDAEPRGRAGETLAVAGAVAVGESPLVEPSAVAVAVPSGLMVEPSASRLSGSMSSVVVVVTGGSGSIWWPRRADSDRSGAARSPARASSGESMHAPRRAWTTADGGGRVWRARGEDVPGLGHR